MRGRTVKLATLLIGAALGGIAAVAGTLGWTWTSHAQAVTAARAAERLVLARDESEVAHEWLGKFMQAGGGEELLAAHESYARLLRLLRGSQPVQASDPSDAATLHSVGARVERILVALAYAEAKMRSAGPPQARSAASAALQEEADLAATLAGAARRERAALAEADERLGWGLRLASALSLSAAALLAWATVMRRRDAAVSAGEGRLRAITDTMPEMVAKIDPRRRVIFHNRAFRERVGLPAEAISGEPLEALLGHERYAAIRESVDRAFAGEQVRQECRRDDPAGDGRDLLWTFVPRYADDARGKLLGVLMLVQDITDLRAVDRMKNEFVSTVSHELRTPLTSIRGSLGLLMGGVAGPLPESVRSLLAIAHNNCERLGRLINDILDIEKIESGRMRFDMQPREMGALVTEAMAANASFAAQQGVRLSVSAPDEPVWVSVDADRFAQVMANLLSNAAKFAPRGSTVNVAILPEPERVRFEVRDRGPGIPESFRPRIFQKFSQADGSASRERGGTGLGLSITKAIVERMAGRIGFTSEEGAGTTFFVELPRVPAPAPLKPARLERATGPRILVCEDDPDVARLIGMLLARGGYAPVVARTAGEARRLLREAGPFAAMTCDLLLPDEDGVSLIRSLRADPATRRLPVVVISARADDDGVRINSEALAVSDWLSKPIDELQLIRAITRTVGPPDPARPRVLHVEDDPDLRRVAAAVSQDFADFEFAGTLAEARERLRDLHFQLVLLDLALPDGSGWTLVDEIARMERRPRVVVFSASAASEHPAIDAFLVKGAVADAELVRKLRSVLARTPEAQPA